MLAWLPSPWVLAGAASIVAVWSLTPAGPYARIWWDLYRAGHLPAPDGLPGRAAVDAIMVALVLMYGALAYQDALARARPDVVVHVMARLGAWRAFLILARAYRLGLGVRRDLDRACYWAERAVRARGEVARASAGLVRMDRGEWAEARRHFEAMPADAHLQAFRHTLANLYLAGLGGPTDVPAAVAVLTRLADEGHVLSQTTLGYLYAVGHEAPGYAERAFHYSHLAAAGGSGPGAFNLGELYERGLHVPRDLAQARRYYEMAAERGVAEAAEALARVEAAMREGHGDA